MKPWPGSSGPDFLGIVICRNPAGQKQKMDREISPSNTKLRESIYEAFDGKCFYTGQTVLFDDMHIDHVVPKIQGGRNCISNYVLTSSTLNLKKNGKLNLSMIEPVLYIIKTVYAPKVLKLLKKRRPRKKVKQFQKEIAHTLKVLYLQKLKDKGFTYDELYLAGRFNKVFFGMEFPLYSDNALNEVYNQ